MTIESKTWVPDLERFEGPKYRAIADALVADIHAGVLKPGDRLPPQRDLAWALKITVGTVTRAYQEAEHRGLVGGEVGRGTFVRAGANHNRGPRGQTMPMDWYGMETTSEDEDPDAPIAMQFNFPPGEVATQALSETLQALSHDPKLGLLLGYQPPTGTALQVEAAILWMAKRGVMATPEEIVISSGAHNAILASISALSRGGGRIATERLVYPGLRAIARILGLDLVPVDLDEEGLCPDSLRKVLGSGPIEAVYTVPTLQNPTNATQSEGRRRELAAVLKEFEVPVVEDDLFGLLPEDAPPPLSTFLPDQSVYITSLSKSLAPGLRVGYLRCSERLRDSIAAAIRGSTWMASPLTVEIASRWILDGTADDILIRRRAVDQARRNAAGRILEGLTFIMPPGSLHAWLQLPDPWHASQFVAAAKDRGVTLSAAHAFSIGRDRSPFAVRICLGPPRSQAKMEEGLHILRGILDEDDPFHDQAAM